MLASVLVLALSSAPVVNEISAHRAGEARMPHGHTRAPVDVDEDHGQLLLQMTLTGEVMGNVAGGLRQGARYLDNLDILFEADLEELAR